MTENRQGLPPASSFEDLEVFKRAYRLSLAVHRRSLEFPPIEQRALADQIRAGEQVDLRPRCRRLCPARRAASRLPPLYLVMALGSADEMRLWCRYCLDLGYLDEVTWQTWRQEYHEIAKMLQGLIKTLRTAS